MYFHKAAKVVYLAHPRTASTSTAEALLAIGFEQLGEHHSTIDLRFNDRQWRVFTVVRNHFDAAVSWALRRTKGKRPITPQVLEWALTPPVNRWLPGDTMWHLHSDVADEILYYEDVDEELNQFLARADLPPVTLDRKNESTGRDGKHYSEFFDNASRWYVENRFAQEMRRFEYEYEGAVPRLR